MALVDSSDARRGDLVLDLGAGDGAITAHLARLGAEVLAFELHPARAARLDSRFAGVDGVTIVRADVASMHVPRRPFHVVANPPFGLASPVLNRLTARGSSLQHASLVLPVSVARRWQWLLDERRAPWALSVESRLPRSAFTPRPRVDCCVVRIRRRPR